MSVNNQMYTLFKNMKQGYAENNDDVVEQCARRWMQLATENPFVYDTPEYEEFFQIKRCYTIWARGEVNAKINRRKMIQHAKQLCALNPKQPYVYDKKAEQEEKRIEEEKRIQEEMERKKKNSENEDIQFVINSMSDAYLRKDEVTFQQDVIHLMDITTENPYVVGMDEYEQFAIMMNTYNKAPINKKRLFEAAKNLCSIINYTEVYTDKINKQTILGVIPETKEEKKSWFKFLHLRKKEGE